MRKIPTLFRRDPDDMRYVTREVHPDCQWVIAGEGTPTRKYDGTCVALLYTDGQQVSTEPPTSGLGVEMVELRWLARREVKPGRPTPANFIAVETDPATGKTVGWEPVGQSSFAKFHAEAVQRAIQELREQRNTAAGIGGWNVGTYELVGPRVNGNPEGVDVHRLWLHADADVLPDAPRDFDGLAKYLADFEGEGIVWHHEDGRMVKLKKRDFPR